MGTRFNACTPRPKYRQEGEVWWHRVGTATEGESRSGKRMVTVFLDSVPVPDKDGQVKIVLFEDDGTGGARQGSGGSASGSTKGGSKKDIDDEIPF